MERPPGRRPAARAPPQAGPRGQQRLATAVGGEGARAPRQQQEGRGAAAGALERGHAPCRTARTLPTRPAPWAQPAHRRLGTAHPKLAATPRPEGELTQKQLVLRQKRTWDGAVQAQATGLRRPRGSSLLAATCSHVGTPDGPRTEETPQPGRLENVHWSLAAAPAPAPPAAAAPGFQSHGPRTGRGLGRWEGSRSDCRGSRGRA